MRCSCTVTKLSGGHVGEGCVRQETRLLGGEMVVECEEV